AHDRHGGARIGGRKGGALAREAGADDEDVVLRHPPGLYKCAYSGRCEATAAIAWRTLAIVTTPARRPPGSTTAMAPIPARAGAPRSVPSGASGGSEASSSSASSPTGRTGWPAATAPSMPP